MEVYAKIITGLGPGAFISGTNIIVHDGTNLSHRHLAVAQVNLRNRACA